MKSAKSLGVVLYILVGLGSISVSLLLSVAPHAGAPVFPQANPEDVVGLIQSIYR
ncbi:MAG TPA: hypothetical protein VLN59_18535 [Burkholderiales bacterium]|nr:hypothetical protein [Burkholderiales bacterium]